MEYALATGAVTQVKEVDRDGMKFGVVQGHIAAFSQEGGIFPDRFEPGCFSESIQDHKDRDDRPVRFHYMHDRRTQIGAFPIDSVKEDNIGLWGSGEINLELQKGREVYALAKQGALSDFSIGFRAQEYNFEMDGDLEVRVITKASIVEGSLVDEPMNQDAQVTGVKSLDVDDVEAWQERDIERALVRYAGFSKGAARSVIARLKSAPAITKVEPTGGDESPLVLSDLVKSLRETTQAISQR